MPLPESPDTRADIASPAAQPIHWQRRAHGKGRPVDASVRDELGLLLGRAGHHPPYPRDALIEYLHLVQDEKGHLPAAWLAALADLMRLSQAEVFEVASFYHHFDPLPEGAEPPPALTVRVCESQSCHMNGARALLETLSREAGAQIRVQAVPCVGRCDQAPVAVVGQNPVVQAQPAAVLALARQALSQPGLALAAMPAGRSLDEALAAGAYGQLLAWMQDPGLARDREPLFRALEASGLRGLGGAGFPAGRKWRIVAAQAGPRLMVINGDEGEVGTFKDRHYLEREPHRVLEGLLMAAWAVQVDACYFYLRDEYAGIRHLLTREMAALQAWWQARHQARLGPLPTLVLRRGAGAYICGEESALIESLEGKRGMPRLRPPYIAERGLFGRPTLAHNVETLYWLPEIFARGASWFASHGRRGRQGLRSFSVSGRVREPGVKLAPAGISLRELVDEYCGGMQPGHELYAYLPGGASGGILPASLADEPLDFDTLQAHGAFIGSAAIVVLSQADKARDAALNLMGFFRDESCGQCTPCRAGTAKAATLMAAPRWDQPLLQDLSQVMMDASICGLGQAAPNPLLSVMRYFPEELA